MLCGHVGMRQARVGRHAEMKKGELAGGVGCEAAGKVAVSLPDLGHRPLTLPRTQAAPGQPLAPSHTATALTPHSF